MHGQDNARSEMPPDCQSPAKEFFDADDGTVHLALGMLSPSTSGLGALLGCGVLAVFG